MKELEIWKVQDATKIQEYMSCPRHYLFRYVLGWEPEEPNIHLVFGSAWHEAMEILLLEGYTPAAITSATDAFMKCFREEFPPESDLIFAPKTPENALRGLIQYCQQYREDDFEVLHTEVAGSVMISETRQLHFKTDAIIQDEGQIFSLEHKTGRYYNSKWADGWRQKMQVGVYTHVLYCLYDPKDVFGIRINGFFPRNAPKMKKDGTPYANQNDSEFHRVPIRKTVSSMNDWLTMTHSYLDNLEDDFGDLLDPGVEDDELLTCFRKNTEACTNYSGCPFLDYCVLWPNPLKHRDAPPLGFRERHWDPRSKQETAKEVVNL